MIPWTEIMVTVALLGCALVGGVFFAFSSFIMRALARVSPPGGLEAMQAINIVVLNRSFLGLFMGTAGVSLVVAVLAVSQWDMAASPWLLAGTASYLLGTFMVTGLGNVPLNNQLAALSPGDPATAGVWEHYLERWTLLNTVRTLGATAAALFMAIGLVLSAEAAEKTARDEAAIVAEARTIVAAYSELGWFSGTVLVAHDGEPVLELAVGLADREAGRPNRPDTRYNLGSIMKHYTAVLVLQQVEAGAISLDDTLERFDLGFPPGTAAKVTVRHLLHHRSGFPGAFTAEYREDPLAFATVGDKLALLRDAELLFEPGSDQRYSNYGYVVLGAILERVTGKPFDVLLQEQVFDRLGLNDSVYPYRADPGRQSLRYSFNHAREHVLVGVTEHHGPDGGIEATTGDVLKFYRALFHGDELLAHDGAAIRQYFAVDGDHWSAFGGGAGVSSAVELDLENRYEIIVLANTDQLVAEEVSGRIYAFIRTGRYDPVLLPPQVFAWEAYQAMGAEAFAAGFRERYAAAGYTPFVGRTLNELGMSLLDAEAWDDAFALFGVLEGWFPAAPQVHDSLAYAWLSRGDLERARESFRKALELQPGFSSDYSASNYGVPPP